MPLLAQSPTNRVILGLMTFGPNPSAGARVTDLAEYNKALDLFQSRGYHEVDTARTYIDGEQEAFTRDAKWNERGLKLATKVVYPGQNGMNTAAKVEESVTKSLSDLGNDFVDILYLHRPDRGTPFQETLAAVDKLHKAGKFAAFGLSNFAAHEVAEVVMLCQQHGWVRPTVYEAMYNVITRNIEPELLPACRRYGLDVVVYNPIAGGLFSGKIKTKDMKPAEGRFSDAHGNTGVRYRDRYFHEGTFNALKVAEDAVAQHGLTMIETALRWTVHHSGLKVTDGNDGIIIGVSSVEQLKENLDHLEKGPLPDGLVKALDQAWHVAKADSPNYWHGDLKYDYDPHQALFGANAK